MQAEEIDHRRQRHEQHKNPADDTQADAGEEDHGTTRAENHQCGSKVGLFQHEADGDQHHDQGNDVNPETGAARGKHLMIVSRHRQRHGDLHQLRGLQRERPDRQPALRSVDDVARDLDAKQQNDAKRIARIGQRRPQSQRQQGHEQRDAQHDGEAEDMIHCIARVDLQ